MVEIGGFLTATRTFVGLVLLPFIYIGFEQSITKAIQKDSIGLQQDKSKGERKNILKNFHKRVSFKGIYKLYEVVET